MKIKQLNFVKQDDGSFKCESIFGTFLIWEDIKDKKTIWKCRSLDKKSKRFYVKDEKDLNSAEKRCQKDYQSMFVGIFED